MQTVILSPLNLNLRANPISRLLDTGQMPMSGLMEKEKRSCRFLQMEEVELTGEAGVAMLLQSLSGSAKLRILKAESCVWSEEAQVALVELIGSVKTLEKLCLSFVEFSRDSLALVAKNLAANTSVEMVNNIDLYQFREDSRVFSIDISDAELDPIEGLLGAELIKLNPAALEITLRESSFMLKPLLENLSEGSLEVSRTKLTLTDCYFLRGIVPMTVYLESVTLSGCAIDDDGACVLAALLADAKRLTHVDLSHNNIFHKGCLELLRSCKVAGTETLDLRGNSLLSSREELTLTQCELMQMKDLKVMNGVPLAPVLSASTPELSLCGKSYDSSFASLLLAARGSSANLRSIKIDNCSLSDNLSVFTQVLYRTLRDNPQIIELSFATNSLPEEFVTALLPVLKNMRLHSLCLSGNKLGQGVVDLARTLSKSRTLRSLDLRHNEISESRAQQIIQLLEHTKSIKIINSIPINESRTEPNAIQMQDFDYLTVAVALCSSSRIRRITLAKTEVNCAKAAFIGKLLQGSTVEALDLSENCISTQGIKALCHGFIDSSLKHLNLAHNALTDASMVQLGKFLPRSTLHSLDLSANHIGRDGAVRFAKELSGGCRLQHLNVSGNKIADEGLAALCEALPELQLRTLRAKNVGLSDLKRLGSFGKHCTLLTTLDLSRNSLGSSSAYIAHALKSNATLTQLNLQENRIGDTITSLFAQALSRNKTLLKLCLRHNRVKNKGAQAISKALIQNSTLTSLDLASNYIGDDGGSALSEALEKNTGLKCVDLRCNKFSKVVTAQISMAWEMNTRLETLRLYNFTHEGHETEGTGDGSSDSWSLRSQLSSATIKLASEASFSSSVVTHRSALQTRDEEQKTVEGGAERRIELNRRVRSWPLPFGKKVKSTNDSSDLHKSMKDEKNSFQRTNLQRMMNLTIERKPSGNEPEKSSKKTTLWRRRRLKEQSKFKSPSSSKMLEEDI